MHQFEIHQATGASPSIGARRRCGATRSSSTEYCTLPICGRSPSSTVAASVATLHTLCVCGGLCGVTTATVHSHLVGCDAWRVRHLRYLSTFCCANVNVAGA
eukprot:scaffold16045_cov110-Isochrysis_galbana.AAC.1